MATKRGASPDAPSLFDVIDPPPPPIPCPRGQDRGGPGPLRFASADEVAHDLAKLTDGSNPQQLARTMELGLHLLARWEVAVLARVYIELIDSRRE